MWFLLALTLNVFAVGVSDREALKCDLGKNRQVVGRDGGCILFGNMFGLNQKPIIPPTFNGDQLFLQSFALSRGFTADVNLEGCLPIAGKPAGTCRPGSLRAGPLENGNMGVIAVRAKVSIAIERTKYLSFPEILLDLPIIRYSLLKSDVIETQRALCAHIGYPSKSQTASLSIVPPRTSPVFLLGDGEMSYLNVYPYSDEKTWQKTNGKTALSLILLKLEKDGRVVFGEQKKILKNDSRYVANFPVEEIGKTIRKRFFNEINNGDIVWLPVQQVICR